MPTTTTSRFDAAFTLLRTGRWDVAFDIVWNAAKEAGGIGGITQAQALQVRNSRNHALGREFAERMATIAARIKQPGLQIAWLMLAADPDKPQSILRFVPQLASAFKLEGQHGIHPADYALSVQSLDRWIEAAEGAFQGSEYSMFTMQFQGSTAERKAAAEKFAAAHKDMKATGVLAAAEKAAGKFDVPTLKTYALNPADDAEPPGIAVMTILTASKLHAEQGQFKDLLDKHLPFAMCPDLSPVRQKLVSQYPHAEAAIDLLLRELKQGKPVRMNPVLLVGPPGAGKSRLFRMFAEALGMAGSTLRFDASGIADSIAFGGTAKAWGHTQASIPARAIVTTQIPNPLVLLDELDKGGGAGGYNGSFHQSLLPYLERETSARHRDVSLDAEIRLDWISYIATANDDSKLPDFIKDRFRVIRIPAPKLEHLPALAYNVQVDLAREAGDDPQWIEPLADDELEVAGRAWAKVRFSMRALQKIVAATVEARSRFPGMRH